jgi:hypothetical protein
VAAEERLPKFLSCRHPAKNPAARFRKAGDLGVLQYVLEARGIELDGMQVTLRFELGGRD